MKRLVLGVVLLALPAWAMETQTLPQGAFSVDVGYLKTTLDKQWSPERTPNPLIPSIPRYEPGGGLQGVLHARPVASFDFLLMQVMYGFTDRLSAGLNIPLALQTTVDTNLSWEVGDYQGQLGRAYSEDDFWAWAASMGQPRVPKRWVGNRNTLSDIVLGARYLLPEFGWMKRSGFRWTSTLQVALPTGSNFDPEEAVSAGTNLWELHAAGDVELHLGMDQPLFRDEHGVSRVNLGANLFGSWFRPRQYTAGRGLKNPLLNNNAFYIGDTYWVDPGDWLGARLSVDVVPFLGPTWASIVSGGSLAKAQTLPPLMTLTGSYTYIGTSQSDWQSLSPLWDWEKEKQWQPGDKNIFIVTATFSFLRMGIPVQVYGSMRVQDIIPGRSTRPANVFTGGIRTLLKFW